MCSATQKNGPTADHTKFKAGSELRERVLLVADRLFAEGGYQNVSMRRIACEIGCSQMAMYRHFPDKDALMQQLCVDLYERFTLKHHKQFDLLESPRERLRQAMRQFVALSVKIHTTTDWHFSIRRPMRKDENCAPGLPLPPSPTFARTCVKRFPPTLPSMWLKSGCIS
jgi:AcrR family transcriptional regulator